MTTVTTERPEGLPLVELDKEDALMAALTNLAYSSKEDLAKKVKPPKIKKPKGSRSSKFWFTMSTVEIEVEEQKQKMLPQALEHIDANVAARLKKYKTELSPELKSNIETVREFFLTELAPLTIATNGGVTQAKEVVQRLLDTEVDPSLLDKFNNMANRAAVMRLALFVVEYFKLPKEHLSYMFPTPTGQDPDLKQILALLKNLPKESNKDSLKNSSRLIEKTVENVIEKFGAR